MACLLRLAFALLVAATIPIPLRAAPENRRPLALQGVNADMLSSGLYSALDANGAFGGPPARARAAYPDLSKGRATAVLDARVGLNVRLGDDPDALPAAQRGQAEPHLFRSAARPSLLLATFQEGRFAADGGSIGNGYSVSRDGGLTWSRTLSPGLTTASGGPYPRATDPVAAIGPQGDFYLNALASLDNAFGRAAVVIQRSTDEGATWSPPIVIHQSASAQTFPDKNWLAVNDFPAAPNSGRLVSTWTNFTSTPTGASTGNHLVAAVSDDRGANWSAAVNITPPGSSNQGSQPVFFPDGSLGVVYITFLNPNDVTQFAVHYKHSADGGRTFPAAATTIAAAVPGFDDPELRDGIFLPSAAVARDTGELFVTYTALVAGTPRVMLTKSPDRGATWTVPVAVSDQPPGRSVLNAAVAASADGRTVSVVFMDKRHAPDGRGFVDLSWALSLDGGATWHPNRRLSDVSSDLRFGPPTTRGVMLGDYLAVVPALGTDPSCVAAWCDTRTGDSDPFTVRFTPAATPDYGAWAGAHRLAGSYLDDADADGTPNYLEFLHGTNPSRAEPGDKVLVRKDSSTSVDVLWTERADVQRIPISDGVSIASIPTYAVAGFGMAATLRGAPLAPELGEPPVRAGLVWRGVRVPLEPGVAYAVGPTLRISAGLPSQAAGPVTAFNTDARLINLSTRGFAGTGSNQMIVGFALEGRKSVLVRAAGPALAALGVAEALQAPRLSVAGPAATAVTNAQWQEGATAAVFARLGAFPFAPGSADAALLLDATERNYTAVVGGADNASGVALVEAYDADDPPGAGGKPRFLNLSARGEAGAGSRTLVAGFVLAGTQPRRVLLRAIGPSLAAFGLEGTLPDPVLTLYARERVVGANDDWSGSRSPDAVAATAARVGAFPLPGGSLDAGLLVTLEPGNYTVVVSGAAGGTGLALVEVYDAD